MKQWFVVQTKPKQESLAEVNLGRQGYETYYPRLIQKRRYRGRWKKIIDPLFPRYLFVSLEKGRDDFSPIRSTLGVTGLIRFGGKPSALLPGLIEAIRNREEDELGMHVNRTLWQPDDEVEIVEGAFAGLKGLFLAECSEERVVILLNMLGRAQEIVVAQDIIAPA